MICKNCSAEYDDSYSFCPKCGKENREKFAVAVPEYPEYTEYKAPMEFTDISSFSDNADRSGYSKEALSVQQEAENYGDGSEVEEQQQVEETQVFKTEPEQAEETFSLHSDSSSVESKAEPEEQPAEVVEEVKPLAKKKRPVRREPPVNRKEENKIFAAIIAIMCVVAVLGASLSALKISTDTLETTEPVEKVVAAVGFSAQEELMLEEVLARCYAAVKTDYNSEFTDVEAFLGRVNPGDAGGVYSRIYNENPSLQTEADPALRFCDAEKGEYSYYRIEDKKIDDILSIFGLEPCREVNVKDCYYYDGYYYFAPVMQNATPVVKAEITKSKRVLDGCYYSECHFYTEDNVQTDTYYLVTEKVDDTQNGTLSFKIKRISTTPIFDSNGKLVEARTYKIKKQVIEGKTNDGKVYCRYTFEYPEFTEDNAGYQAINRFFIDAVNSYSLRVDSAQKAYESFISQGGKDSDLPLTETVIARVGYENENYISIVEKIGVTDPTPVQTVPETTQADDESEYEDESDGEVKAEGVKLFTRTFDGYVFDKTTGEFVSKDVLAGKDYMVVSEILYRIYNGYEYESIIPETKVEEVTDEYGEIVEDEENYGEEEEYSYSDDEIPDDEDGFGTILYESACALTENGLTFYYVNENGIVEEVTIPFAVVERLAQA